MTLKLENGNCLELMKNLPDKSIDLFICDLPYGETNCKWDSKIDLEEFWKEFKRLRKSTRTACIHFCSTKFGYTLIKSNEKMFKMDMVWKKRNKTGGLQSKKRPMRNHEMVYFFYEQAPKYNRDKYHKRIANTPTVKNKTIKEKDRKLMGESSGIYSKENQTQSSFDPPNPSSEEKYTKDYLDNKQKTIGTGGSEMRGIFTKENIKKYNKENGVGFSPPNPASVVEEEDTMFGETKKQRKERREKGDSHFVPPNPASVLEEYKNDVWGQKKWKHGGDCGLLNEDGSRKGGYTPPNPASVLEEDEPKSMFESTNVFIGKRHHQTEKPQDILEFFLKYWSDEGETILDPTMGSGSTGVACKKLNRNFIGFELNEKIFEVAKNRIN